MLGGPGVLYKGVLGPTLRKKSFQLRYFHKTLSVDCVVVLEEWLASLIASVKHEHFISIQSADGWFIKMNNQLHDPQSLLKSWNTLS